MTGYNTGLNGIRLVSRAEYDSKDMDKTEGTLYVVQEEEGFSMYLGTAGLVGVASNSGTPYTAIQHKRASCLAAKAAVPHAIFSRNYERLYAADTDENMYIDTGYLHTADTSIVIDCVPFLESHTRGFPFLFGTKGGSRYWDSHAWGFGMNGTNVLYARGHNTGSSTPVDFDPTQRSVMTFTGGMLSVQHTNGTQTVFTDGNAVVDDGVLPLWLFNFSDANDTNYYSKTRFYSCQIYEGDTLVRDFVPVRRLVDGTVVLYDMVEMTEYEPQGGGGFTEIEEG